MWPDYLYSNRAGQGWALLQKAGLGIVQGGEGGQSRAGRAPEGLYELQLPSAAGPAFQHQTFPALYASVPHHGVIYPDPCDISPTHSASAGLHAWLRFRAYSLPLTLCMCRGLNISKSLSISRLACLIHLRRRAVSQALVKQTNSKQEQTCSKLCYTQLNMYTGAAYDDDRVVQLCLACLLIVETRCCVHLMGIAKL